MAICPNCQKNTPEGRYCEHCGASLQTVPVYTAPSPPVVPVPPQPETKPSAFGTVLSILGVIVFIFIIVGVFAALVYIMAESGNGGGSTCSTGYAVTSFSNGHCCPDGYPYYYDGKCHQCSKGYYQYDTSAGYCCPEGYSFYYDDKCHQCSKGYYKYDTSYGHCCPDGYPYYYNGQCWNRL